MNRRSLLALAAALALPAPAQPPPPPDIDPPQTTGACREGTRLQWLVGDGVPGVDGLVHAMAIWDPDGAGGSPPVVVVGGLFTVAGETRATNIATLDTQTRRWTPLGIGVAGRVRALATTPDGRLIAAGDFTVAGGVAASYIARWDGATWAPLGSGTDGAVWALSVLPNGDVVAGGSFTSAGGAPADRIARWNGVTWAPMGSGANNIIYALTTLPSGDIVAGGTFTIAGGTPANRIARWNGTTWAPMGSGVNNAVRALTTLSNGDVVAGGYFTIAGGIGASRIARWNGSAWAPIGQGMNGDVWSVGVLPTGDLVAGGGFTSAGGVAASRIARWNGTTWSPVGLGPNGGVFALAALANGELYAGGSFDATGDVGTNSIARWDGSEWSPIGVGFNGDIRALATLANGDIVVGGDFTTAPGTSARRVAIRRGSVWAPLGSGMDGTVHALTTRGNGEIVAGGSFLVAGSTSAANRVARWDGNAWQPLGSGMDAEVYALATLSNGDVVAAGTFTIAGGAAASRVARWNGSTWSPLGSGVDGPVYALAARDSGELIAGGFFTTAGGVLANNVARWQHETWSPLGSGTNRGVAALATPSHDDLVAAGGFWEAGGITVSGIARWNGVAWSPLGSGLDHPPGGSGGTYVRALMAGDGELYAGGLFESAGGVTTKSVARWDGTTWRPIGSGVDWIVWALGRLPGGGIIAGGGFAVAGGQVSASFAQARCARSGVVYVDRDAPGGDGSTWGAAFRQFGAAMSSIQVSSGAATETWVAEGVYGVAGLTLPSWAAIRGGFAGNESRPEDANWLAHPTILSAVGSAQRALDLSPGSSLDGFRITGGSVTTPDVWGGAPLGGGVRLARGSTVARLARSRVFGNYAEWASQLYVGDALLEVDSVSIVGDPNSNASQSDAGADGAQLFLSGPLVLENCRFLTASTLIGGDSTLWVDGMSTLAVRPVPIDSGMPVTSVSGNATFLAPCLTNPTFQATAQVRDVVLRSAAGNLIIAPTGADGPGWLTWRRSWSYDLSAGGEAECRYLDEWGGEPNYVAITGSVYHYPYTPGTSALFTGELLTAQVGGFRFREVAPNQLQFVFDPNIPANPQGFPRLTNLSGWLTQDHPFQFVGTQVLDLVLTNCSQNGGPLVDFQSPITVGGEIALEIRPELSSSVSATTTLSCNVAGQGRVHILPGATLKVQGGALIDMNGGEPLPGGCADPNGAANWGRIDVEGQLLVEEGTIQNTNVNVLSGDRFGAAQLVSNQINLPQNPPGWGGELYVSGESTIQCNVIFSEGDRYLDLDPDPNATPHPDIGSGDSANQIDVAILQVPNSPQGELLELRSEDVDRTVGDGAAGPYLLPASAGEGQDKGYRDAWALRSLRVRAEAKVNLTNRSGLDYQPASNEPEALYVRRVVLEPNAVLNVGLQRMYYQELFITFDADPNSPLVAYDLDPSNPYATLPNEARLINVPLLGFSLKVIAMESDDEFAVRVRPRLSEPNDLAGQKGVVERVEDIDPLRPGNGVMRMLTRKPGFLPAASVAAHGAFARAGDERILVAFEYKFCGTPGDRLRVYMSDQPEVGDPNRVFLAEIGPPADPNRPGSIGSQEFALFRGEFPRGSLNFRRGTYVELELSGPDACVLIDEWDPHIYCSSECGDVNEDEGFTRADYLVHLAAQGRDLVTHDPCAPGYNACLDYSLSRDGYADALDLFGLSSRLCCGGGCAPAPFEGGAGTPVALSGAGLLVTGQPAAAVLPIPDPNYAYAPDKLYRFDVGGSSLGPPLDPASAPYNDRLLGNGRLTRDALGRVHQLHVTQGLVRLEDGRHVVERGEATLGDRHVYVGIVENGPDPLNLPTGLSLLDAAFAPGNANVVYVAPAYVKPAGRPGYRAAARIALSPGGSGWTLEQLYAVEPNEPNCGNTTPPEFSECNRQFVREVEVDGLGNVYVLAAQAANRNDWLMVYDENTGQRRAAILMTQRMAELRSTANLLVSADGQWLYATSGIDADAADHRTRVYRFPILRNGAAFADLGPAETFVIAAAPCEIVDDPNFGPQQMQTGCTVTVVGLTESGGDVFVLGLTQPRLSAELSIGSGLYVRLFSGDSESRAAATLARIPGDIARQPGDLAAELPVQRLWASGLGAPVSIVAYGAAPTPGSEPRPCPGDADGNGRVDQDDLDFVLFHYGAAVPPGTQGDLDHDGDVDQDDVDRVLVNYGTACP